MASLRLENNFSLLLGKEIAKCSSAMDVNNLFSSSTFVQFIEIVTKLVLDHHYLHISNIPFSPRREVLEAIAGLFGTFRYPVENTRICVDCTHDGCSIEDLPLHNDDAILDVMPMFGILQVEQECPLNMPTNGIVLVDELVSYLELHNTELLRRLLTSKVPMLASKTTKVIENNEVVFKKQGDEHLVKKSILFHEEGVYKSRFSLGRIKYYYFKNNLVQPKDEKNMIVEFMEIANRLRKCLYIKQNDILIYNNQRTLHDRSECGIEVGMNGKIKSRSFYIAFAN